MAWVKKNSITRSQNIFPKSKTQTRGTKNDESFEQIVPPCGATKCLYWILQYSRVLLSLAFRSSIFPFNSLFSHVVSASSFQCLAELKGGKRRAAYCKQIQSYMFSCLVFHRFCLLSPFLSVTKINSFQK